MKSAFVKAGDKRCDATKTETKNKNSVPVRQAMQKRKSANAKKNPSFATVFAHDKHRPEFFIFARQFESEGEK